MKKKVLIIGGAGFIGYHVAKRFLLSGYFVDIIDLVEKKNFDTDFRNFLKNKNVTYKKCDLVNDNFLIKDIYIYILNFAAIVGVQKVNNSPSRVLNDNILICIKLLSYIQKFKKLRKYIFSSTSEIYNDTYLKTKKIPFKEDCDLIVSTINSNRSTYMLSKLYGEALSIHSSVNYINLRFHNIYGPRMGYSHVIPEFIERIKKSKKKVEIFSPSHRRTFCYVSDAATIIYKLCLSSVKKITLNCGSDKEEISMYKLAKKIIKLSSKKKLTLLRGRIHTGSPTRRLPSLKLLKKKIKIKFKYSLEEGLKKTIDWYNKK